MPPRPRKQTKYRPHRYKHAYTPAPKKEKARKLVYNIPAGTECHVRRIGETTWSPHRTRREVYVVGYIWRNEYVHGFLVEGWELKVANGRWRELDGQTEPRP